MFGKWVSLSLMITAPARLEWIKVRRGARAREGEWRTYTAEVKGQTYRLTNLNLIQESDRLRSNNNSRSGRWNWREMVVLREVDAVRVRPSGTIPLCSYGGEPRAPVEARNESFRVASAQESSDRFWKTGFIKQSPSIPIGGRYGLIKVRISPSQWWMLLVVVVDQELLNLSPHPRSILELRLCPHGQRDHRSVLGGWNALATPTCQGALARVTEKWSKEIRGWTRWLRGGRFCQRPDRYLGLPFIQATLDGPTHISRVYEKECK